MTNSARQTQGEDDDREADLESGVPEDRTLSNASTGARGQREKLWDLAQKITLTATMSWISDGYAKQNSVYRAIGFGHLSAYSMEKSAASWPDREATATKFGTGVGTAVWAAGTGTGNKVALTLGPAVNTTSSLISAGLKYAQGKAGWARDLVDAAEMAAFTAAGMTQQHPVARAVAFSATGAGFFWDAVQERDKGFIGHGAGALVWAVGAGMENESWQAAGAGAVALSEFARLAYPYAQSTYPYLASRIPYLASRTRESPAEAASEHPGDEPMVRQETALTEVAVPAPVPDATVVQAARPLPSGPAAETTDSQDTPPNPVQGMASQFLPGSPVPTHADASPTIRKRSHSAPGSFRSMTGENAAQASMPRSPAAGGPPRPSAARRRS